MFEKRGTPVMIIPMATVGVLTGIPPLTSPSGELYQVSYLADRGDHFDPATLWCARDQIAVLMPTTGCINADIAALKELFG